MTDCLRNLRKILRNYQVMNIVLSKLGCALDPHHWKVVETLVPDNLGSLALEGSVYRTAQQVDCVTLARTSTGPELQYGEVTLIRPPDKTLSGGGKIQS